VSYAFGTRQTSQEDCVISVSLTRIAAVVVFIAISTTTAKAWPHRHGQKVRVQFLATSTLIRGTWGQNEDTYLAELHLTHSDGPILVRLIDAYPNEVPPLSRAVLVSDDGAVLLVKRDAECDLPFGRILLRAAPGDPMAILLDKLQYEPRIREMPAPSASVQCYRIVRR
jgi:hypothetical protein